MLLQISVVQRMKANHNTALMLLSSVIVVANISCSKNESKSQRYALAISEHAGCCKYQLFKEWKQITTIQPWPLKLTQLLQISVVQRMKANHNYSRLGGYDITVVANISCSKNESKSQLYTRYRVTTFSCCKYQLFKEWKQITTRSCILTRN